MERRLADEFHLISLAIPGTASRLELLQAILFELGVEHESLSEQEARLRLIEFLRRPANDSLVLLIDDADQLAAELLDELRSLSDLMHEGRPLIRLALFGQLELDERLATPELDAFNRRIGCQLVLDSLDRSQSAEYVRNALAACGAIPDSIFTPEALHLICVSSDGNLRCLNHLCDHSLLLACVMEERPVEEATVRAALDDLQALPLNWSVPAQAPTTLDCELEQRPSDEESVEIGDTPSIGNAVEETHSSDDPVVETSMDSEDESSAVTTVIEFGSEPPVNEMADLDSDTAPAGTCCEDDPREGYRLDDRYADLDRIAERNPWADEVKGISDDSRQEVSSPESQILVEIAEMRHEVRQVSPGEARAPRESRHALDSSMVPEHEWDVVQPEDALPETESRTDSDSLADLTEVDAFTLHSTETPAFESGDSDLSADRSASTEERDDEVPRDDHRYAFLFTRLRNRRRNLASRSSH